MSGAARGLVEAFGPIRAAAGVDVVIEPGETPRAALGLRSSPASD